MSHACSFAMALAILVFHSQRTAAEGAGTKPIRCEGHTNFVMSVDLSPDGKLAVSCGDDVTVRVWNTADGSEIRNWRIDGPEAPYGWISDVAFAPDGKSVAAASHGNPITFWNHVTGEKLDKSLPVEGAAFGISFSPDGSQMAVAESSAVKLWDISQAQLLHDFKFGPRGEGRAWRAAFSPNAEMLAAALHIGGENSIPVDAVSGVRAWNTSSGERLDIDWKHWNAANAVSFSPDGKLLAAAIGSGLVEVWSIEAKVMLHRIEVDDRVAFCLAFSPDGKTIATGGNDPEVKLWSVKTGKPLGMLKGHEDQVSALCYSRDGKTLVSAGRDKMVLIWTLGAETTGTYQPDETE